MMNSSSEPQAFGAGTAGSSFNLIEFLKKPQVILRILGWIFAIIVFACIAQEGYWNDRCRYNGSTACNYGIAIGVIAFVLAMLFTGLDIYFPHISNIGTRKAIVLAEMVASGIWTLLWFIGFCFMTDQWRQEPNPDLPGWNGRNSVQAALAFSFFSFFIWGALCFFTFRRFRDGVSNLFTSNSNYPDPTNNVPHSYGPNPSTNFSPPPFTATPSMPPSYEQAHY